MHDVIKEGAQFVQTVAKRTVGRYADNPSRLLNRKILFGNIIPELLDNIPHLPTAAVELPGYNARLAEAIIPGSFRTALLIATGSWQTGETKGAIFTVGSKDTGSSHPHLFEIERDVQGIKLLFVDPEHTVGGRNLMKPSVIIIMEAKIHDDKSQSTEIAYLRYRSDHLDPKASSVRAQYEQAEGLRATNGITTDMKEHPEDILFRLVLNRDQSTLQTRLTFPRTIRKFLQSGNGTDPLNFRLSALRDTILIFQRIFSAEQQDTQSQQRYQKFKGGKKE